MAVTALAPRTAPPRVVDLLANPVRWRLLGELAESDRSVGELTERVGEAQNLVSYHLRQLRDAGLVSARRSAFDRRDVYYAIDLLTCERELQAVGGALHPGLRSVTTSRAPFAPRARRRARVLFLCTGNSARSQIAEALAVHLSDGAVVAASAGSAPKPLHPNAVRVMRRRGIDISTHQPKHLDEVSSDRFDVVVTLCDKVREVCPELPSHPRMVHWSIADPALEGATSRASYPAFERTVRELETRIHFLLHQLPASPRRRANAERRDRPNAKR